MAKIELRSVLLGESEHKLLLLLIEKNNSQEFDKLYEELDSATVLADQDVPVDVVRMHSFVTYKDESTQEVREVQVVYPGEVGEKAVSVLAPIGAALIGLREGESITWPLPGGKLKTLAVLKVVKK